MLISGLAEVCLARLNLKFSLLWFVETGPEPHFLCGVFNWDKFTPLNDCLCQLSLLIRLVFLDEVHAILYTLS